MARIITSSPGKNSPRDRGRTVPGVGGVLQELYGTLRDFVEEHLAAGVDLVMDIEIQGALQVKERMPAAVLVFLLPPSLEELERRIQGRGTEDAKSISSRLQVAIGELQMVERYDYAVVNDDVAAAAGEALEYSHSREGKNKGNYRQVLAQFWEQVPFSGEHRRGFDEGWL